MGSVYRCHNRAARRILAAVKVLELDTRMQPGLRARFIREAEILFNLDHPNIVKVRNVRMDTEPPYIEMEFVNGENLEARILRGGMPTPDALSLMRQMADAMAYLHARGIRHRDIKPSNIVVQANGVARLVDFGIATETQSGTLAEGRQMLGSVRYVPPEWARPNSLDATQWDIYSLGMVFYEVLTGKQAFSYSTEGPPSQRFFQVMAAKQGHPPLDPGPTFTDEIRALVRDMTAAEPERRLKTAFEVLERLNRVVPGGAPSAPSPHSAVPTHADETFSPSKTIIPSSSQTFAVADAANSRGDSTVIPDEPRKPWWQSTPLRIGVELLLLIGALSLVRWEQQAEPPPPERTVDVVVSGLAADVPVLLHLEDRAPVATGVGRFRFSNLPVGKSTLHAVVGPDCAGSPTPAWCVQSEHPITVTAGNDVQIVPIVLKPPQPRNVRFQAPAKTFRVNIPGVGTINGSEEGAVFLKMLPGTYTVEAEAGQCPASARNCGADCPPGCASWVGEVVVGVGEGEQRVDLSLNPAPVNGRAPTTSPSAPANGGGKLVTQGALARWLATRPEWLPNGEKAPDGGYLGGWANGNPPNAAGAAVDVSWALADAFCAGRGGLADIEAAPLSWGLEGGQPWMEFRQAEGRPAWRRSDGVVSRSVSRTAPQADTGFRCAR